MQSQPPSGKPTDKPQQQQGTSRQEQPGRQTEQQNRKQQDQQGQRPSGNNDPVQGEGDYRANRRYTESAKEFVESGKVDEAARKAKPQSQQEADDMRRAEQEGASHAKGGKERQSGGTSGAQRK